MADTALHNWPNADGDWRGDACSGLRLLRRGEGGVIHEEHEQLRVCRQAVSEARGLQAVPEAQDLKMGSWNFRCIGA